MSKRCEDCRYHAGNGELMGITTCFCRVIDGAKLINDLSADLCAEYSRKWWKFWRPK